MALRVLDTVHALWLRPRLLGSIAVAIALALVLPSIATWSRVLIGWCAGVVVFVGLIVWNMTTQSADELRREASRLDDSAAMISLFALLAATASVGGVGMLVFGQQEQDAYKGPHIVLAAATILCAWIFVQVVFTVHYLHIYYGEDEGGRSRGGLDFNGDDAPDFWDFLYFAVTIGTTSQTSDTDIRSKHIRRIVTAHAVYSFFFNTSLLALAINMGAGFA
ncbi:DUF1345 domain-containing protein [Methylobacterium sp. WSM2598]|uniref:DUF1345 domain-containing protein n=1 Tax=Methylobacterium sp. WSM2598 TaxID=398261 RepID=UPI00036ADFAF|nr:DUF1345 domain-containing protein [Methylobacterium sp. WSM2598]